MPACPVVQRPNCGSVGAPALRASGVPVDHRASSGPCPWGRKLDTIDAGDLEWYVARKRRKGLGPRTINRHLKPEPSSAATARTRRMSPERNGSSVPAGARIPSSTRRSNRSSVAPVLSASSSHERRQLPGGSRDGWAVVIAGDRRSGLRTLFPTWLVSRHLDNESGRLSQPPTPTTSGAPPGGGARWSRPRRSPSYP